MIKRDGQTYFNADIQAWRGQMHKIKGELCVLNTEGREYFGITPHGGDYLHMVSEFGNDFVVPATGVRWNLFDYTEEIEGQLYWNGAVHVWGQMEAIDGRFCVLNDTARAIFGMTDHGGDYIHMLSGGKGLIYPEGSVKWDL